MSRKTAIDVARKLGVTVFKSKSLKTVECDAPKGYVFSCDNSLHMMSCSDFKDAIERMEYGVEKCEEPDCEVCAEVMDKTPQEYADWMQWELVYGDERFNKQ